MSAQKGLCAAALLIAASCSDQSPVAPPSGEIPAAELIPAGLSPGPRTMDVEFYELASEVPGFGGAFRDEQGNAIAYLRDLSRAPAAESALRRFAEARGAYITGNVNASQGQYDWRQLYHWRQSLDELLVVPGVVQTDIDESKNRIVIGTANDGIRSFLRSEISRRGIPSSAVEFSTAGYPVLDASLQSTFRPVAGGQQIQRTTGFSTVTCTLGFIGISNSAWFVTNSHCTSTMGSVGNNQWYQATVKTSNFIGTEQIDPPFFSGGSCPPGSTCRWSDSSLGSFGTGNYARGKIKRTSAPNTGSLTIVGDFRITGERAYPEMNMLLNKVGRSTGWTTGSVQATCVNVALLDGTNRMFLCQDKVSYSSSSGDSGSPVFTVQAGNDVWLTGIHWGRDPNLNLAIMSAMVNIQFETLQLNTCDTSVPPTNCS